MKFDRDLKIEFKKSFEHYRQISWRVLTTVALNFVRFAHESERNEVNI
jgi:hypothetical protein